MLEIDRLVGTAIEFGRMKALVDIEPSKGIIHEYLRLANKTNAQKNALATAIAKGTNENDLHQHYNTEER